MNTPAHPTTDDPSLWVTQTGDVWLYVALPTTNLRVLDDQGRLRAGAPKIQLIQELAATSIAPTTGSSWLDKRGFFREVHEITHHIWAPNAIPADVPLKLSRFLTEAFGRVAESPNKTMYFGVKLRASLGASTTANPTPLHHVKALVGLRLGDKTSAETADLAAYEQDAKLIRSILARTTGYDELGYPDTENLKSWVTSKTPYPPVIVADAHRIVVDRNHSERFFVLRHIENTELPAATATWAASIADDHISCVSVRYTILPKRVARQSVRRSLSKVQDAKHDDLKAQQQGSIGNMEVHEAYDMVDTVERVLTSEDLPVLDDLTVVVGRIDDNEDDTFVEHLNQAYGIHFDPFRVRQDVAYLSTLPGGMPPVGASLAQSTNPLFVSHSGIAHRVELGDNDRAIRGKPHLLLGFNDKFNPVLWLPEASSYLDDIGPMCPFIGRTGSGKTNTANAIAAQAYYSGRAVAIIDLKQDSKQTVFGRHVAGDNLEFIDVSRTEPGSFAPSRFLADPVEWGERLVEMIATVFGWESTDLAEVVRAVNSGISNGALCELDAVRRGNLRADLLQAIENMMSNKMFSSMFAPQALPPLKPGSKFLIISMSGHLDLPDLRTEPTMFQRIAVKLQESVVLTILTHFKQTSGGLVIIDESHNLLANERTVRALQKTAREGRQAGVTTIPCSQIAGELAEANLLAHISQCVVFATEDPEASLKLVRLPVTPSAIAFLENAGPKEHSDTRTGKPAQAYFRDSRNRVGPITFVWPHSYMHAATTNPEHLRQRKAEQ